MPVEWTFDPKFDCEFNDDLIGRLVEAEGCFSCGTKLVDARRCSACKVAGYCNQECQKKDWKQNDHKGRCKVYRDNLKNGEAIPICLCGALWIDEELFGEAMRNRRDCFLNQFKKAGDECSKIISMSMAVVYNFDAIYLMGGASLIDDSFRKHTVDHVLCEKVHNVDDDMTVKMQLYQGSGVLSDELKHNVVDRMVEFLQLCKESGVKVFTITAGRGMVDFGIDEMVQAGLKESGLEVSFMRSMEYM